MTRPWAEFTGLDDQQRIANDTERRLNRGRQPIPRAADLYDTPTAAKRQRANFVGKTGWVVFEGSRAQRAQTKRIARIGHHGPRRRLGALAHKALIRSVTENRSDLFARRAAKPVGLAAVDFHGVAAAAGSREK